MIYLFTGGFVCLMLFAAYSDLRSYTLPNFISIALIILFIAASLLVMPPWEALVWHIGIASLVFLVGFLLFAINVLGGGDVKVISALALWFGPSSFMPFFVIMAFLGGILALFLIIFRKISLKEKWLQSKILKSLHNPHEGIPYGVAIAPAALIELPKSEIYLALSMF